MSSILRGIFGGSQPQINDKSISDTAPAWAQATFLPSLQSMSIWSCTHPVYTIAFVALMASTSYVGFLQSTMFDAPPAVTLTNGQIDMDALLAGSKTLYLGEETGWRWQNGESKLDQSQWAVRAISFRWRALYHAKSYRQTKI